MRVGGFVWRVEAEHREWKQDIRPKTQKLNTKPNRLNSKLDSINPKRFKPKTQNPTVAVGVGAQPQNPKPPKD